MNSLLAWGGNFSGNKLYRFRLHRNDLTAENTEDTEGENRDMNNSDATGFDIKTTHKFPANRIRVLSNEVRLRGLRNNLD
jgi:hypothetical protein